MGVASGAMRLLVLYCTTNVPPACTYAIRGGWAARSFSLVLKARTPTTMASKWARTAPLSRRWRACRRPSKPRRNRLGGGSRELRRLGRRCSRSCCLGVRPMSSPSTPCCRKIRDLLVVPGDQCRRRHDIALLVRARRLEEDPAHRTGPADHQGDGGDHRRRGDPVRQGNAPAFPQSARGSVEK